MRSIYFNQNVCPECSGFLVTTEYNIVCAACGLEVSGIISDPTYCIGSENGQGNYYTFPGARAYLADGLGTDIDHYKTKRFRDFRGRILSQKSQNKFKRLRTIHQRVGRFGERERNFHVLCLINRISALLNLPKNVRNRAGYYYKKISKIIRKNDKEKKRRRNSVKIAAFCILAAVKEDPKTIPIRLVEILRCFKKAGYNIKGSDLTELRLYPEITKIVKIKARRSEDYIDRIIDSTLASKKVQNQLEKKKIDSLEYKQALLSVCKKILEKIPPQKRGGRDPYIMAAATVYAADKCISKIHQAGAILTQRLLAKITDVAEYSIREHFLKVLKAHVCKK
ncbi:MAG: hypothetical protein ACETVN_03525 [Asgard group archaeon]